MHVAAQSLLLTLCSGVLLWGSDTASLTGLVQDASGQALPEAQIVIQRSEDAARWRVQSDDQGHYTLDGLREGTYKITVRRPGFRTVSKVKAALTPGTQTHIDFTLELIELHEVVTVIGSRDDDADPAAGDSMLMTRKSPGAALPANGRDFRVMFDLMPGVSTTPAAVNDGGQFTANGQRPNSNSFRVDGLSINTGVGGTGLPGSLPGASLPAMTAGGSMEHLGAPETAESVEFKTSSFAPESGSRPGAEMSIVTRSGSNDFHGDFFGHLRPPKWTTLDPMMRIQGDNTVPPRDAYYGQLGLTLSGPVWRDHTYVLMTGEESSLIDRAGQLISVPSLETRASGVQNSAYSYFLDYPLPYGPNFPNGQAPGRLSVQTVTELQSVSGRIDQTLGRWGTLFVRSGFAGTRGLSSGLNTSSRQNTWYGTTAGLTSSIAPSSIHEFRVAVSSATIKGTGFYTPSNATMTDAKLFPTWIQNNDGSYMEIPTRFYEPLPAYSDDGYRVPISSATVYSLSVPGLSQTMWGGFRRATQDQMAVHESLSIVRRKHDLRLGWEMNIILPRLDGPLASVSGQARSLQSLLAGDKMPFSYVWSDRQIGDLTTSSVYAQDTYRFSPRITFVYGARWEYTPPIYKNFRTATYSGLWDGSSWSNVESGNVIASAQWPKRFAQLAPRLGVAYKTRVPSLTLRGGIGMYYDTALSSAINPLNGAPFNAWQISDVGSGMNTPPPNGTPPGTITPDVTQFLAGNYPALRLPASYQWRVSLEQAIPHRGVVSAGYNGSIGRNLVGNQVYVDPTSGILKRRVALTQNSSSYNALQLRYTGSPLKNLFVTAAYTWSHSIDNGSQDSALFLIHPGYSLDEAKGSSSFDLRHTLTASISYKTPRREGNPVLSWLTRDWIFSSIVRLRTGFPIDVMSGEPSLGAAFDNTGRPDLIPGVALWLRDSQSIGHRRLNPAAFHIPTDGRAGSLSRNVISGNGLMQVDMNVRRQFRLLWRVNAEVTGSVFNVFNRANYADPVPYLSSPWFGQSTSMQNLMMGTGTPNTGLAPLFQNGGPRSAEFSFRVSF